MMKLKQELTRRLWVMLPPDQQQVLIYDFLDWLYSDFPPILRQEKTNLLAPRLMQWIAEGKIGLSLILYLYLKRLPLVSMFSRWAGNLQAVSDQSRLISKW